MENENSKEFLSTGSNQAISDKSFRGVKHFIGEIFLDLVGQSWALVGLTVAWLVLEGSAKRLTGILIISVVTVWMLTFPFRHRRKN